MTIQSSNFPTIKPALTLDFANSKRLDPRIAFARGSQGTYVDSDGLLKTAASGVARFTHDPVTGESLGLLVEEQRVNLLHRTEEFDNAAWTTNAQNVAVLANQTIAPNSTSTADLLTNTTTSQGLLQQNITVPDATALYTFSAFVKSNGAAQCRVLTVDSASSGARLTFTFSTESLLVQNVGATGADVSGTFIKYPNGWYRLIVTGRTTAAGTLRLSQISCARTEFGTANEDGTSGIYLWGAQLEAGAFPTSYIKNFDNPLGATRAADVVSISGSNFSSWYNQSAGTVLIDWDKQFTGNWSSFQPFFTARDDVNPGDNFIAYHSTNAANNQIFYASEVNNVPQLDYSFYVANSPGRYTAASALTANSAAFAQGGIIRGIDSSLAMPTTLNEAIIAASNSTIRRITYWPSRLPDSTLQTITL